MSAIFLCFGFWTLESSVVSVSLFPVSLLPLSLLPLLLLPRLLALETSLHQIGTSDGKNICWGCGSTDHSYYNKKEKKVICPKANDPRVQERADKYQKEYVKGLHKCSEEKKALGIITALLAGKVSKNKQRHMLQVLKSFSAFKDEDDNKDNKSRDRNDTVVLIIPLVLQTSNMKPQLPINIIPTLPHVKLLLGTPESDFKPVLAAIVYTGITLCVDYGKFSLPICETYPQLVKTSL